MIITPQVFFDLFVLCLSWQHDFTNLSRDYTTVDKVARILHGIGIVTDLQRRKLYKDRRVQSLFARKTAKFPLTTRDGRLGREGLALRREEVLSATAMLAMFVDVNEPINKQRMLRDQRLYLTRRGLEHGQAVAPRYSAVVDREKYSAEEKRQDAMLEERSKGAVLKRYRAKVEDETTSDT
jgi:hypothetical protein